MATRAFTQNTNLPEMGYFVITVALAASDDTAFIDVTKFRVAKIEQTTASFGTGNITITAQSSDTGLAANAVTLGSAATVTGDGTGYVLGSATADFDISTRRFIRVIRGGDANVGTVTIRVVCSQPIAQ